MSHYLHQEFDFVERTKKIIEQYDSLTIPEKDKFEVTLLLNCLVGLLILPQQNWYDNLPSEIISQKEWGITPEHISFIKRGETKNIKDISRHLRNSVAHYRFKAFDNSSNKISRIKFEDFEQSGDKTFEALIPLANLRQFTNRLSDNFMTEMNKLK
jgi:hypothetical protein